MFDMTYSEADFPEQYGVRLGAFLRARRQDMSKTQIEIGIEAGMDAAAISRLERGLQRPRMTILYRLSKILDTSICDMMAAAEGVSDVDDLRRFLLYKSAPPVYRDMVDTALRATEFENSRRIGPVED